MEKGRPGWSGEASERLYGFRHWGGGCFAVDPGGDVRAYPLADGRGIRVLDVVAEARAKGLVPPLNIRFHDLLRHRVAALNAAFREAVSQAAYGGVYRGVFPIKVNHLREVVEEVVAAGEPFGFGLEAGSKPELLIALALHRDAASPVICNGYKDADYIRLALLGRKLGKEVVIVLEQPSELEAVIEASRQMKVEPLIGVRAKLTTTGEGKWAGSTGERAKFGLTAPEMMRVARRLGEAGLRGALRLLHFHIGSQVPNIITIKEAVVEATRFYCELHRLGFPMGLLDVGGGLGVDYDGSRTNFESSMNYTLEQYARDVVFHVAEGCRAAGVPEPDIVSESGRAVVAPHSLLVLEVVGRTGPAGPGEGEVSPADTDEPAGPDRGNGMGAEREHPVLRDLQETLDNTHGLSGAERFQDAQQKKEEAYSLFRLGYLDLPARARAEELFWRICRTLHAEGERVRARAGRSGGPGPAGGLTPEDQEALADLLAAQYVCNFSVFQSLIDHWACGQLFPVAPLHRLAERPTVDATLVDITCDSEGKISRFIDLEEDSRPHLPLHPLRPGEPYYLGVFLTGAYQDTMGDLHNLFGRAGEVHVFLETGEEGGFYIEESVPASTVQEVLKFTQYEGRELGRSMKQQIDRATRATRLKPREGVRLIDFYNALLRGGTYLRPAAPTAPPENQNQTPPQAPPAPPGTAGSAPTPTTGTAEAAGAGVDGGG